MMSAEKGMYVRMGKLSSPEAEYPADHYYELRDRKDKKREEIAREQAGVEYLDYSQLGTYISNYYKAGNSSDRLFWQAKVKAINDCYGEWLDDYTKKQIAPVLHWRAR